ncbi:tetratricopeptide repeat protein, partial [Candidatus Sumerlaeota bacterium]|nr:tetratricopeptide repeat protein [Candidatus Sumerlaeota bacterium]
IYEERYQYFLLPLILLLILETLIHDRRSARASRLAFLLMSLPFLFGFQLSDPLSKLTEQGNAAFEKEDYVKALEFYKNAQVESPESPELHFNIGNVFLKEQKYEEAIKEFEKAAALFREPERMANAHYNIGVARYRIAEQLASMENYQEAIKKLEEAMAANQNAMRKNPSDEDPKFNYEQSKRLWKQLLEKLKEQQNQQQQRQEQQQQNEDQKQDQRQQGEKSDPSQEEQKKQEQQKSESGENQEKKEEEKKEAQKQEEKEGEKKEEQAAKAEEKKEDDQSGEAAKQEQQEAKIGEMSKEDALRILSALPEENRDALKEALKTQYGRRPGTDKDW